MFLALGKVEQFLEEMQINGNTLSEAEVREMLDAVREHLVKDFGVHPHAADLLAPADVKAMFESNGTYPAMYRQLGKAWPDGTGRLRHCPPLPWPMTWMYNRPTL